MCRYDVENNRNNITHGLKDKIIIDKEKKI